MAHIVRAQRASHITPLGQKYIPYGSFPRLLFPKWRNLYRAPYCNGNPNIGPRIIGNLDQYPDSYMEPLGM